MASKSLDSEWPQFRSDVSYSNHSSLNTLEWCIPQPTSGRGCQRVWIVYIHGGAWQDPMINASSFNRTRDLLLASSIADHVAGYASINYRLSPYPSHPDNPSNPDDPARNAHHPDHIRDVLDALLHLQETFRFGTRYLLVGHSCGATLAFQVAMRRYWGSTYESTEALEMNVAPPRAILGVAGLYDLPALVSYHSSQPVYRDFVINAFGSNEQVWEQVSPAHAQNLDETWSDGRLVVLAHSHEDGLVEWEQVERQHESLVKQGWETTLKADALPGSKPSIERQLRMLEIQGGHDQVWNSSSELARAIEYTVQEIIKMNLTIGD